MAVITIGGATFNVSDEGDADKPALILAHPLGATLSIWDAQMPALLPHFRVVRYDSRGHGATQDEGAPFGIARLGNDVLAIMAALGIGRAHFAGLSMGGAVGQWLIVNAADRFERVVLANTAARLGTPDVWNERIARVLAGDSEGNAQATAERWFSADFARDEPATVEEVRAMLRDTPREGYARACAALRDMDLRRALHGRSHPVLVISGADDPAAPAEDVATLLAALPDAEHVVLPVRHASNIEAADAFNAAIVRFLTGKLARRSTKTATVPRPARPHGGRRAGRNTTAARRPAEPAKRLSAKASAARAARTAQASRKPKPARSAEPAPPARKRTAVSKKPAASKPAATKRALASPARRAARGSIRTARGAPAAGGAPARTIRSKTASPSRMAVGKAAERKAVKPSAAKTSAAKTSPAKTSPAKRPSTKPAAAKSAPAKSTPAKAGIAKVGRTGAKATPAKTAARGVGRKPARAAALPLKAPKTAASAAKAAKTPARTAPGAKTVARTARQVSGSARRPKGRSKR